MRGNGEIRALEDVLRTLDPEHGPILARRWLFGEQEIPNDFYEAALIGFSLRLQRIACDLCQRDSSAARPVDSRGRQRPAEVQMTT